MTPVGASAPLIAINALASAIWIGGLVAIFVVARAASRTLGPEQRVAFFRALGRSYGVLGTSALLVAMGSGALLLSQEQRWDGLALAGAAVALALLLATFLGMAQARAMTRLRQRALSEPVDPSIARRVQRGAVLAGVLRGGIGMLTLALLLLTAALLAG